MSNSNWVEPEFVVEATEGKVFYDVELPEYTDPILVNYKRLNVLRRLAGVSIVGVVAEEGRTSSESYSIAGMTQSGEAVAGKRRTLHVPESNGKNFRISEGILSDTVGYPGIVTVNTNQVRQNITQKNQSLRSSEGWSNHLNKAISSGFIELSDQNHIGSHAKRRAILSAVYVLDDFIELANGEVEKAAVGLGTVALIGLMWGAIEKLSLRRIGASDLASIQPSPFLTFRIERALATRALADLIKCTKPKEVKM